MKLLPSQIDDHSLAGFGHEAVALLTRGAYGELASRFGYALAYGRGVAEAIADDYARAASAPFEAVEEGRAITVRHFKPNPTGLHALVECRVPVGPGATILMELLVHGTDDDKQITLEDISGLACCSPPVIPRRRDK